MIDLYIEIQRHNDYNEKEFENFNLNILKNLISNYSN